MSLRNTTIGKFLALLCAGVIVFGGVQSVFAQAGVLPGETISTNPKDRPVLVTASVGSDEPEGAPPYPVLVSPPNNAVLTSGVVVFEWRMPPGHPALLDRFELYINGSLKFGSISPGSNQETSDYILTITNGNEYRLALKQDKWLPDGSYTWKIRVVDIHDLGSDSSTWSFVIDSTPPNILITNVGENETALSAADPTTIPTDPLIVQTPGPVIVGQTESGAQVQLAITYPDGSVEYLMTTADANGRFRFTLSGLPANKVLVLTFTAVDGAGLSRVLDGVRVMYRPKKIVIPLPPLFPHQPAELSIFYWRPGISREFVSALKDLPAPLGPLIVEVLRPEPEAPTSMVPDLQEQENGWYRGAWMLWYIFLFGYVFAVFALTRNAWGYFGTYLRVFIRFWLLGSGGKHRWIEGKKQERLPFYGATLSWLDEKRRYRSRRVVTDPQGNWRNHYVEGRVVSIKSEHPLYPFPSAQEVEVSGAAAVVPPQEALLWQEHLAFRSGQNEHTAAALIINDQTVLVALTASKQRRGWPAFLTYLPRVILVLMILLAILIVWQVKTWFTILLIIFTLWMFIRDIQGNIRQKLEIYAQ